MTPKEQAWALVNSHDDVLAALPTIASQDGIVRIGGAELIAIEERVRAVGVLRAYADNRINLGLSDPASISACAKRIGRFIGTHATD